MASQCSSSRRVVLYSGKKASEKLTLSKVADILSGFVVSIFDRLCDQQEKRRVYLQMASMSDRQLDDIGLTRDDLDTVLKGSADQTRSTRR